MREFIRALFCFDLLIVVLLAVSIGDVACNGADQAVAQPDAGMTPAPVDAPADAPLQMGRTCHYLPWPTLVTHCAPEPGLDGICDDGICYRVCADGYRGGCHRFEYAVFTIENSCYCEPTALRDEHLSGAEER